MCHYLTMYYSSVKQKWRYRSYGTSQKACHRSRKERKEKVRVFRSSSFTEFEFAGIGSDSRCNFVISDPKNYTLHVVDWQGKFLFYVLSGEIIAPMALNA